MKSSIGTYRQEPRLLRDYYIFTSDAACKKAYDLMTASSVTGAISNVFDGNGYRRGHRRCSVGRRRLRRIPDVWQSGGSTGNGAGTYNNPASGP